MPRVVLRACRRAASLARAAPLSALAVTLPASRGAGAAALSSLSAPCSAVARRAFSSAQTFERAAGEEPQQPHAEATPDPETQILQNAIQHVAEHGYEPARA
jgi:hypothetical protein